MSKARLLTSEIKKTVWPALQEIGFSKFTPRDAWRRGKHTIECVNFLCYGAQAWKYRATGLSFNLSLGVYYPQAHKDLWPNKPIPEFPEECECDVRATIPKIIDQEGFDNDRIWYVDQDGSNLSTVIEGARESILSTRLTLMATFTDPVRALNVFRNATTKVWKKLGTDQVLFPAWEIQCALANRIERTDIAERILDEERRGLEKEEQRPEPVNMEARDSIAAIEKLIRRSPSKR